MKIYSDKLQKYENTICTVKEIKQFFGPEDKIEIYPRTREIYDFPNHASRLTLDNYKKKQNIKGELVASLTIGRKMKIERNWLYPSERKRFGIHSFLYLKVLQKDEFSPELKAKFVRDVMPELRKFFERDEEVCRIDMGEQVMLVERRGDDFVLHIYPRF